MKNSRVTEKELDKTCLSIITIPYMVEDCLKHFNMSSLKERLRLCSSKSEASKENM